MATTTRKPKAHQLQSAIMYPLDWIEERSGLVGGVKYFLFRKVPGDVNWFTTLGSATLTAFLVQATTGVFLAMYYKPDPNGRVRVDPAHHERRLGWLARAGHAPLGRVGVHHPHVHAHGPRLPVRRVQVPARAELDHRRAAARDGPGRRLHGLSAALGPDGVLGHGRRHQHQRHRTVRGAIPRAVLTRRHVHQPRHAVAVLFDPHAVDTRCHLRPDRVAPVSRDPARRDVTAVVEGGRRARGRSRVSPRTGRAPGS